MSGTERFELGFGGRAAVVTGGGTGMGRELVRQLAADGCDVATCDISAASLDATAKACADDGSAGEVFTFVADVSDEDAIFAFRDAVALWRPQVHLLFNNAGVGGGGSLVTGDRESWDKTFAVCWTGVYLTTRAFLPLLLAADVGHVVNTSSINGIWSTIGGMPNTAYSSAKFAVRGFTEALITDFRLNAPHLRATVVHPGWVGTDIVLNSAETHGFVGPQATAFGEGFRDNAPVSAAEAAAQILDGVKRGEWRILVGADAVAIDEAVRRDPALTFAAQPAGPPPG